MPNTNDGLYTVQFWRDRAEQARLMALRMSELAPQALMHEIAANYDTIGTMVDHRDRSKTA
jgi:hypothetical protein